MDENITNSEAENTFDVSNPPSIDELQKIIMQKMADDEVNQPESFDDFESIESFSEETSLDDELYSLENDFYDISPDEKKYVVAMNPDLVPFFDKLSVDKRTALVNQLVLEHVEAQKKVPEEERIKKLIKHSLVVFITVAIGLPSIFYITNASIEATVNSYREVQGNFEKLYKEKGGIKRKDLTKMQNLKY